MSTTVQTEAPPFLHRDGVMDDTEVVVAGFPLLQKGPEPKLGAPRRKDYDAG
jgi:hypothetical protein